MEASQALLQLFATAQLFALERQLRFPESISDSDRWDFDMGEGAVKFSSKSGWIEVPVQLLGTEGYGAGTWLWAWANTGSGIPPHLTRAAQALQQFGEAEEITELAEASVSLEAVDGHSLAMVASFMLHEQSAGYYRCPYEGGALFVLLTAPDANPGPERPLLRATVVLPQVAEQLLHVGRALEGYAQRHSLDIEATDEGYRLASSAEGALTVRTTENGGRLLSIEGSLRDA